MVILILKLSISDFGPSSLKKYKLVPKYVCVCVCVVCYVPCIEYITLICRSNFGIVYVENH